MTQSLDYYQNKKVEASMQLEYEQRPHWRLVLKQVIAACEVEICHAINGHTPDYGPSFGNPVNLDQVPRAVEAALAPCEAVVEGIAVGNDEPLIGGPEVVEPPAPVAPAPAAVVMGIVPGVGLGLGTEPAHEPIVEAPVVEPVVELPAVAGIGGAGPAVSVCAPVPTSAPVPATLKGQHRRATKITHRRKRAAR